MLFALLAVAVAITPASRDLSWESTARQLREVAETYKKWGITFELDRESKFTGANTPVPAHLEVTGSMESPDSLAIGIQTVVGQKHALAVQFGGKFKVDPAGNASEGNGAIYVEGRGLVGKYQFSKDTGISMEAGIEESLYSLGINLGKADVGPFSLGLKLGPLTVKLDPTTYAKRFAIMAPVLAGKGKEKIGGVTMRVDADALLAAITEAPAPPTEYTQGRLAVSLKGALSAGAKDLGLLTSLDGVLVDEAGKDIVLVGRNDSTLPQIPMATIATLARCIYVNGKHPWISIDPQPDYTAPHHARIGDVPSELLHSALVETMLAADYSMKQISLGKHKIEGISELMDMLSEEDLAKSQRWRLWISPAQPGVGDIRMSSTVGARYYAYPVAPVIKAETTLLDPSNADWTTRYAEKSGIPIAETGPAALLAEQYTLNYHAIETAWPDSRFGAVRQQIQLSGLLTLLAAKEKIEWESSLIGRLASVKVGQRSFPLDFPGLKSTRLSATSETHSIAGGMMTTVTLSTIEPGAPPMPRSAITWKLWQGQLAPPRAEATEPTPMSPTRAAELAQQRAEEELEARDGEAAETDAREALALRPAWDTAQISLVRALALQNKESCKQVLSDALLSSPKSWRLLLMSAMLYEGQHDYFDAAKYASRVIALSPQTTRAYAIRARCRNKYDYAEAVKDWQTALRLDPGNAELLLSRAGFYLWQERPNEALADLNYVTAHSPATSRSFLLKGELLLNLSKPAEAVAALKSAVRLAPADWLAHDYLGRALYSGGEFAAAADEMTLAYRFRPRTGAFDVKIGTDDEVPALFRAPVDPIEELIDRPEDPDKTMIVEITLFDPVIWVVRGAANVKLGRYQEALKDLRRYSDLADMFHEYSEKRLHALPINEVKAMIEEAKKH